MQNLGGVCCGGFKNLNFQKSELKHSLKNAGSVETMHDHKFRLSLLLF